MTGIVVIDGKPIQSGIKVWLHLHHEIAGKRSHVRHVGRIFGCNNEPELMPVIASTLDECLAVGLILKCGIDPALLAILRNTIAFQIPQVRIDRLCRSRTKFRAARRLTPLRDKLYHPCLDHDTPRAEAGAAAITRPSSTVFGKRRYEFRTTASGIEAPPCPDSPPIRSGFPPALRTAIFTWVMNGFVCRLARLPRLLGRPGLMRKLLSSWSAIAAGSMPITGLTSSKLPSSQAGEKRLDPA